MQPLHTIVLYKRHSATCDIQKSKMPAKAKRFSMDCACPIWMVGRCPKGEVPRQTTGVTKLREAEAIRRSLFAGQEMESERGSRIDNCIATYVESRNDIGHQAKGHYTMALTRLQMFCAEREVFHMRDLTVDLLETFKVKGFGSMAETSKATLFGKVRRFLKDAHRRGWTDEPLALKVESYKADYEEKEPYTDAEVKAILEAVPQINGDEATLSGKPKTFRLLLELMLETGLRVSDATRYEPANCIRGEHMWVYTYFPKKQRKLAKRKRHEVYIPDALKKAIDQCDWMSQKRPFYFGDSSDPAFMSRAVYHRMQRIGVCCHVSDCRPHRLRDTFAVRKFIAGFQLDDVSRLLGHSSVTVTEKFYAKWVTPRASRLERLVRESLVNS